MTIPASIDGKTLQEWANLANIANHDILNYVAKFSLEERNYRIEEWVNARYAIASVAPILINTIGLLDAKNNNLEKRIMEIRTALL